MSINRRVQGLALTSGVLAAHMRPCLSQPVGLSSAPLSSCRDTACTFPEATAQWIGVQPEGPAELLMHLHVKRTVNGSGGGLYQHGAGTGIP